MHVLFVHPNYPAQFGHVARYLAEKHGWQVTCLSEKPGGRDGPVERIRYRVRSGATQATHFHARTFENAVWHADAVYQTLKACPSLKPDVVVGHSGFGSTVFLRELYPDAAVVNYFEYYYHPKNSDLDFRPDFPPNELERLRARPRNAMILLDLENCDLGLSPTRYQHGLLPARARDKVRVIFDGIDTRAWVPARDAPRRIGNRHFPTGVKLVSYVSRGMESMRGFDVFMKAAQKLADGRRDVIFLVSGEDRVCYGNDRRIIGGDSFKDWVLSRGRYDLSRFVFLGWLPQPQLARLFQITDAHVYLTVPFVLSWSLLDAMSCGAVVLASDTAPVREVVTHQKTGLLTDFFDADALADLMDQVLDEPAKFRPLGDAAAELVRKQYSVEACLPRHRDLYADAAALAGR